MRWTRPGFERALGGVLDALDAEAWPDPPHGFEAVEPARPMRVVLHGAVMTDEGRVDIALKWNRPVTRTDRLARRVRGGKGRREGQALRALEEAGVPAVRALAFTDEPFDVLITRWVDDLETRASLADATYVELADIASVVRAMQCAGVQHNDLHVGNLGFRAGHPMLVDLGGATTNRPVPSPSDPEMLAQLAHGLLGGTRRTTRLRAFQAWCEITGVSTSEIPDLLPKVERHWAVLHRNFLRGRDRRATREGRHFHLFDTASTRRAIRNALTTDESWEGEVDGWIDGGGGELLKVDGRVRRVQRREGAGHVVLKVYPPISRGRLPRPLHAFRVAEAMTTRGIPVPRPYLAAARSDGSGILVSESLDAPNLHTLFADGSYDALPLPVRRRLLACLGRMLRHMHDSEISHRDLKAPNLVVSVEDDEPRIWIVDLDGARVRYRPLSWARRVKDFARLDASLGANRTDRLRVFDAYCRVLPWPPVDRRRLLAGIAHHVARKRGPTNAPR